MANCKSKQVGKELRSRKTDQNGSQETTTSSSTISRSRSNGSNRNASQVATPSSCSSCKSNQHDSQETPTSSRTSRSNRNQSNQNGAQAAAPSSSLSTRSTSARNGNSSSERSKPRQDRHQSGPSTSTATDAQNNNGSRNRGRPRTMELASNGSRNSSSSPTRPSSPDSSSSSSSCSSSDSDYRSEDPKRVQKRKGTLRLSRRDQAKRQRRISSSSFSRRPEAETSRQNGVQQNRSPNVQNHNIRQSEISSPSAPSPQEAGTSNQFVGNGAQQDASSDAPLTSTLSQQPSSSHDILSVSNRASGAKPPRTRKIDPTVYGKKMKSESLEHLRNLFAKRVVAGKYLHFGTEEIEMLATQLGERKDSISIWFTRQRKNHSSNGHSIHMKEAIERLRQNQQNVEKQIAGTSAQINATERDVEMDGEMEQEEGAGPSTSRSTGSSNLRGSLKHSEDARNEDGLARHCMQNEEMEEEEEAGPSTSRSTGSSNLGGNLNHSEEDRNKEGPAGQFLIPRRDLIRRLDGVFKQAMKTRDVALSGLHMGRIICYGLAEEKIKKWYKERRENEIEHEKDVHSKTWPIIEEKRVLEILEEEFKKNILMDEERVEEVHQKTGLSSEEIHRWFLNKKHEIDEKKFLDKSRRERPKFWTERNMYGWRYNLLLGDLQLLMELVVRATPPVELEIEMMSGLYNGFNLPKNEVEAFFVQERHNESVNRRSFCATLKVEDSEWFKLRDHHFEPKKSLERFLEATKEIKLSTQYIVDFHQHNPPRQLAIKQEEGVMEHVAGGYYVMVPAHQNEIVYGEVEPPVEEQGDRPPERLPISEVLHLPDGATNNWNVWTVDQTLNWAAKFLPPCDLEKLRSHEMTGTAVEDLIASSISSMELNQELNLSFGGLHKLRRNLNKVINAYNGYA